MITQEDVRRLFEYRDGALLYRRAGKKAGKRAGSIHAKGYWRLKVKDKFYFEHRLVWLYFNGEWPETIDHLNGVRNDNRIENLRSVSTTENLQRRFTPSNNTSGFKGVVFHKSRNRWRAQVQHNGKAYTATFPDIEDAATYYNFVAANLFGENALYNTVPQPWLEDQNPDGSTYVVATLEPIEGEK